MPTLDEIVGTGPSENAARTPHEGTLMKQDIVEDLKALEEAEKAAKGLRRGEARWQCVGCDRFWIGTKDSHAYKAYQAHRARHAHARGARDLSGN